MDYNIGYSILNGLCLFGGVRRKSECFSWGPGMRDSYSLHYVTSGKGTLILDGNEFSISEGQSFLVFPFSNVTIKTDSKNPWEYYWIEFRGLEVAWLIDHTTFTKSNPVVGKIPVEKFEKLFEINDLENRETYGQCRSNAKLFLLLSYYLQFYPRINEQVNNFALMARDYIDKNYRNADCTVQKVSEHIKIDRTYLFRLFKEETGMSVLSYINKCRISKATIMLSDKNISIKDVAYSVGFVDQMYFSKVFKKIRSCTPSEYRKLCGETAIS